MPVVIPEKAVAEAFKNVVYPIVEKINTMAEQIIFLTEARDRLLPKMMSREIKV